ncbi:NOP58 family protein [Candidatus Woesearchaeota archaeon]|nr:NOP58 family protein [Candidatus Woesearchaeota archaeon]
MYLYTNIIGSFVLNKELEIVESLEFEDIEDYLHKYQFENKLQQKHKNLQPLPDYKEREMLVLFKDDIYMEKFYKQNLELAKHKLKLSVTEDQLIIQTIANVQELDRVINLLSKRLREWYSLYYPELAENMTHHEKFAEMVATKTRKELLQGKTMGADLEEVHVKQMTLLAKQILGTFELQKQHKEYLKNVMEKYCPNVLELAGTTIGAKLLELSKSLKRLAMLPASTVQLLGAEKALFRHLKTGSRSPKYGAIFHHPIVQNAPRSDRGKAARLLADKLAICAKLDFFKGEFLAPEYKKLLEDKFNVKKD